MTNMILKRGGSMNKNRKFIVITLSVLILLTIFQLAKYINNKHSEYEIIFRKSYGNINLIYEEKNGLSLAFIVKNNNYSFKKYLEQQKIINNLSFNTDKIIVEDFKLVKSLTKNNYSYYYLNLTLIPSDNFAVNEYVEVDTIRLGEDSYYIGDLTFRMNDFNKDRGKLEVNSANAMSLGIGLKDYSATIQNYNTDKQIIISKVDTGRFEKFDTNIFFEFTDGTVREFQGEIMLEPKEIIEFIVKFDKESAMDYDVFYFSPLIYYTNNAKYHTLYFYYYSSGLSISDDEFKTIIQNSK